MKSFILLFLNLSLQGPEISQAVKPDCTCLVFSQTYGKERGTFTSPDYPKSYPRGIDCLLYTFIAAPEQIVELTFADFDVNDKQIDCPHGDFIKLYPHIKQEDIDEYERQDVGKLCGKRPDVPRTIYSSGTVLMIELHTASTGSNFTGVGFLGYYRFIKKELFESDGALIESSLCDFVFTSWNNSKAAGHFHSPNYPSSYASNIKCRYHFYARSDERIQIIFEKVNLQVGDAGCLNQMDVIKIYDGVDSASPIIALLCNDANDVEFLSSRNNLLVEFSAFSSWPGQGFTASFQFQTKTNYSGENIPSTSLPPAVVISEKKAPISRFGAKLCSRNQIIGSSCDAFFHSDTSKNGTFTSMSYPLPYEPRSHCRYDFQGRGREKVQIVFQDFNIFHPGDDVKECDNIDSLQAFVYIEGRTEKIDSYCGSTLPKQIMSNGPKLMLEFRGLYSSRNVRGFRATYNFIENYGIDSGKQLTDFPCAFTYNSSESRNGSFTSPNYPGPYPRDTECHYFFYGSTYNEKVHIHFTYFDVEGVLPCEAVSASDFVEFSNYMARDRKYNRYCGQLKEFHVESDKKFFRVTFRSNDRLDGTGFKANYRFIDEIEPTTRRPNNGTSCRTSDTYPSVVIGMSLILLFNNV